MKRIVITFSSITYATKARRLLSTIDISSRLVKVDLSQSKDGCTYGIEIAYNSFLPVIETLRANRIPYSVLKSEDGNGLP